MHVSSDMDFKEFKSFCDEAWNMGKHGYTVINLWEEPYCGKYVQNYEYMQAYIPAEYKQIIELNRIKSKKIELNRN